MIKCCQLFDLILGFKKFLFKPQEFVKFWSLWNCLLLLMKLLFWGPRGSFWFLVSFLDSEDRKIFISFLSIDSWEIDSFLKLNLMKVEGDSVLKVYVLSSPSKKKVNHRHSGHIWNWPLTFDSISCFLQTSFVFCDKP